MKKVLVYFLVFVLMCLAVVWGLYRWIDTNAFFGTAGNSNISQVFEAKEGDGSTEVGQKLEKEGLIRSKYFFYYYVWKTKTSNKLQAGEYEFSPNMTIGEIVEKLSKGDVKPKIIKFTVPEGYSNKKIIALLQEKKPSIAEEFAQIVNCECLNQAGCACDLFGSKYDFLGALPDGAGMEGYLFPDTYFIDEEETGATLASKFLNNYQKRVSQVFSEQVAGDQRSLHRAMIIASLLEREVPNAQDRGLVAGIIEKRLELGMALQIDATICYLKEPKECLPITAEELALESPYNTYLHKELPPGPIGNPGFEAISAALSPEKSSYLFYLSDPQTKQTVFSVDYEEHLLNVNKYLR